ncbi:MAG TPA: helix-turn-helix transcriptional regulator [Candidatus Acidoferrales bacterium]|nr:helix-turn-helix transcriptional regulator [Candidatus Acidoferrales bacterium]
MSDRSQLIKRLLTERDFRASYIRAKLDVLIPSQIRALRLRQDKTQSGLAQLADMKQARISAMETGQVNFNLETLVRVAASLNVGLMVKFIPFSEMLGWENDYSQDIFNATQLANDTAFLRPRVTRRRIARRMRNYGHTFRIPERPETAAAVVSPYTNLMQTQHPQMRLRFGSEGQRQQAPNPKVVEFSISKDSVNELLAAAASSGTGAATDAWRKYGT